MDSFSDEELYPKQIGVKDSPPSASSAKLMKERDLKTAIENCRILILQTKSSDRQENSNNNKYKQLVKELIELRRQLHELKEGITEDVGNLDVCGHRFLLQTRRDSLGAAAANRFCDKCGQLIWSFVQNWYKCKSCGFYCHAKCINVVTRLCAITKASEEPIYELNICPEKGLAWQKYRCAECKTRLNIDSDKQKFSIGRLCDYNGLYYCPVCHWEDTCVIPARVVRNWDFEPHPVSRCSKQFLKVMQKKPVLLLEALNPHVFNYIKELRTTKALRQSLLLMKPFLLCCREASGLRLFSLMKSYPHFFDGSDAYCLQDLIDLNNGTLESHLRTTLDTYSKHIKIDCETCRGNGFVCEFCSDKEILFPFDDFVVSCRQCSALFHRLCYEKYHGQCPRCQRRNRRDNSTDLGTK